MANSLIRKVTFISDNEDDDDGDDLFADYYPDSAPTQPLSRPLFQQNAHRPQSSHAGHVTQPTQPLPNANARQSKTPDASSTVQVNASSPLRAPTSAIQTAPLCRGALNGGILAQSMAPPGTQFRSPVVQNQQRQSQSQKQQQYSQSRSQTDDIEFSDDGRRVSDSSDDNNARSLEIKKSVFVNGGKPINASSEPGVVEESPVRKPLDVSRFTYQPSNVPQKRSADTMANAYGGSRKSKPFRLDNNMILEDILDYETRNKVKDILRFFSNQFTVRQCFDALNTADGKKFDAIQQLRRIASDIDQQVTASPDKKPKKPKGPPSIAQASPSKALPTPEPDISLNDIHDASLRLKIEKMRNVFSDQFTVRQCQHALTMAKGHYDDALSYLASAQEDDSASQNTKANQVAIDLTSNDIDELNPKSPNLPTVKRDVKNVKTINEKWASQSRKQPQASKTSTEDKPEIARPMTPPAKKPKRKLIRPVQPPSPTISSPPLPAPVKADTAASNTDPKAVINIESDIDEGIDLRRNEVDEDSESEEEATSYSQHELDLLKFLNDCSTEDLLEVSNQSEETVNQIISRRPYANLEEVRDVTVESTTTTKTGRTRTIKKKLGERFVDNCLEMWDGYTAVDELVAECEQIGKPVKSEMRQLGFDASAADGELQLVDLEALDRDSGIGTPYQSSPIASGDEGTDDTKIATRPHKKKANLLPQPALMSKDCTLKDYQLTGLNWLALLFRKKMSAILADDMGLGKTIQVIAFLAHLYESGTAGPHLVVVPGSTLENWLREFQTFCPKLQVEPYYGSQKERGEAQDRIADTLDEINVIVTTYDMAVADLDARFFRKVVRPTVCVFDEGHTLKNSRSKRYKQLMRIPAEFRLLLTGTPLQNNLQELISLLAFIMPRVFRPHEPQLQAIFKYKGKSVDDSGHTAMLSSQRISRARAMITPFILRRKKEQVLKHLPRKVCRVEYCDMTDAQKSIYNEEVTKIRAQWSNGTATSKAKAKTNVLMELRKAAIHPFLFRRLYTDQELEKMSKSCLGEPQFCESNVDLVQEDMSVMTDYELLRFCRTYEKTMSKYILPGTPWMESGKVNAMLKVLRQNVEAGHRTLIFSQFTLVMDILEEVLQSEGISFSRLDGATKMQERQDLIDQFTTDESISVFMLSTKAGGAGINLACANKVIIFDSSFNPQDDIQAENRAHRVGQLREVEVVRLVTKGTIEEQIHALGKTKLALDDRVAGDSARDTKEDAAIEKEGMEMVERMLKGEPEPTVDTSMEEGVRSDVSDEKKSEPALDMKAEYMKGLKEAGLKVSDKK